MAKELISGPEQIEKIVTPGDPTKINQGLRKQKLTKTDFPNKDSLKESMDFKLKHLTLKDRVISLMKRDKLSRKNDFYLCILYWIKCGHIKLIVPLEDFQKINAPESISRCRREIFKEIREGKHPKLKYLINQDAEKARNKQEKRYEGYYHDKNNEKVAGEVK